MKKILLVITIVFTSNFLHAQTGQHEDIAIKMQREKEDFEDKVQKPFSSARRIFVNQIKELLGSEKDAHEFSKKIPDSLNPIDSLKVALYVQTYKKAILTYRISTIEWICSHTDSYMSPSLIEQWWPREGWRLIYNALSENVRSKYGQALKTSIENSPKTQ